MNQGRKAATIKTRPRGYLSQAEYARLSGLSQPGVKKQIDSSSLVAHKDPGTKLVWIAFTEYVRKYPNNARPQTNLLSIEEFSRLTEIDADEVAAMIERGALTALRDASDNAWIGIDSWEAVSGTAQEALGFSTDSEPGNRFNGSGDTRSLVPVDPSGSMDLEQSQQLSLSKALAENRRAVANAGLAELELKRKAGELVDRASVDLVVATLGQVLNQRLEALPARVAPLANPDNQELAEKVLREEVDMVRRELSGIVRELVPSDTENNDQTREVSDAE